MAKKQSGGTGGTAKKAAKKPAARKAGAGKKGGARMTITADDLRGVADEKSGADADSRVRDGIASLALATEGATAALDIPSSPASCQIWRGVQVFQRIMDALSAWSEEPLGNIGPSTTLGALAKGTPWNIGQQARLVQATNMRNVFAPFQAVMAAPTVELPASTTVAQWIDVVWRMQTPRTFCFVFAS